MAGIAMTRIRGAAIILAMLIAALAAAVAATVFADQQRWSRTVEHRRDQVQAQALAMAGVQWTRQILDEDARRSAIDHLGEPWALTLPPIPIDDGEIRGAIVDAQGRLNINALGAANPSAEEERARLARLFAQRGLPAAALDAIADWIDADGAAGAAGAEDAFYLAQPSPRLAANAPVLRVAELGFVKGVTPQALAAVLPFVAALPAGTPVNVNTAPREVLAAIVGSSDRESARGAARRASPQALHHDRRVPGAPARRRCARERRRAVGPQQLFLRDHRSASGRHLVARARPSPSRRRRQAPGRMAGRGMTGTGQVNYGDDGTFRLLRMTVLRVLLAAAARGGPRRRLGAVRCRRKVRAHRARSPDRVAEGGQARVRARRLAGARRVRQSAAAARVACRGGRGLRARRSAGRSRRRPSHRGFRARQRTAASAWRSWRNRCWRASRAAMPAPRGSCPSRISRRRHRAGPGARAMPPPQASSAVRMAVRFRSTPRRLTARCRRSSAWRWGRPVAADHPRHTSASTPHSPRRALARWQRETGIDFQPGTPWRWEAAPAAAFAGAIDLLPRTERSAAASARTRPARLFATALFLASAALFLHVVATVGEWASLRFDAWRAAREWTAIAAAAGIAPDAATTPTAARAALARRYAAMRHAQGLPAPDDALPLLARATPALAALPPGSVKSAIYADGHWTLDLARPDAAAIANLDAGMRAAGVPALVATSAAGTRVRFGGP